MISNFRRVVNVVLVLFLLGDSPTSEFLFLYSAMKWSPGAHTAPYTMGTGSFPGVKRPGRGVDQPPPSSAEVKERVELYLYFLSEPLLPVLGW